MIHCTVHGPLRLGLSPECAGPAAEDALATRAAAGLEPVTGRVPAPDARLRDAAIIIRHVIEEGGPAVRRHEIDLLATLHRLENAAIEVEADLIDDRIAAAATPAQRGAEARLGELLESYDPKAGPVAREDALAAIEAARVAVPPG